MKDVAPLSTGWPIIRVETAPLDVLLRAVKTVKPVIAHTDAKCSPPQLASASQATEIGITADEVNTVVAEDVSRRIKLPFILISTNASTQVDGQISKDSTSVMLDFSEGFTLSDDEQLLRLLGLVGNALPVIPEMQ